MSHGLSMLELLRIRDQLLEEGAFIVHIDRTDEPSADVGQRVSAQIRRGLRAYGLVAVGEPVITEEPTSNPRLAARGWQKVTVSQAIAAAPTRGEKR